MYLLTVSSEIVFSLLILISFAIFKTLAVVHSFLANDFNINWIFSLENLFLSSSVKLLLIIVLTYDFGKIAGWGLLIFFGQPPRIIKFAILSRLISFNNLASNFPFAKSLREIKPEESPDSYKDIVIIFIETILPAPECNIPFVFGVAEPVKINWP